MEEKRRKYKKQKDRKRSSSSSSREWAERKRTKKSNRRSSSTSSSSDERSEKERAPRYRAKKYSSSSSSSEEWVERKTEPRVAARSRELESSRSRRDREKERDAYGPKSYNWKKKVEIKESDLNSKPSQQEKIKHKQNEFKAETGAYLSDENMNKLAAKLIKAEIMGDKTLINKLKTKLEAARQYRKDNPNAGKDAEVDDGIMLTSTNSSGNCRPLSKPANSADFTRKKKANTHQAGERMKYFFNDDKFTLPQMVEEEKYGNNYDNDEQMARIAGKHKNPNDDLEDVFTSEISKNINSAKMDARAKQRAIHEHKKVENTLDNCYHCIGSKNMLKHLMVSCGEKVYLALPARKSLVKGHCFITTIQHMTCVTALDEDVWEEIMNYRKALTKYFNTLNMDVVFFETAVQLNRYPHMVINCVPLPRDVGECAPIYFKKALLECEAEWAMNKKLIDLKGKNIRKGIPKGLPYFWIDFGMDPGFAHVIEDHMLFPKNFAEEIIGGILDLDHSLWKKPQMEYGEQQRKKVMEFTQSWKPFDTLNKR